ncbi:peptidylprolyl isomerase [Tamlana fucoidanivorans]|uniref:Peptidylprolyl isomerase n=1 Tax=Allotamlana fucoidanivorans TaxID=2583814 RepID=A0A5C4SNG4_9FLAO|nr:peptidylprolyl isomerase [Tamlana fucoidanivorans]TNJ45715.1 peptidylprolyl isomerase [Tamlana fucoidanivorans]
MKLKQFLPLFFCFLFTLLKAQTASDAVLFTLDNQPVYAEEFLRVYNKNLDLVQDDSQKDVDAYLKLFTNYKLKLQEAKALGFHEKKSYLRELSNYKKQLAQNYITDPKVTDALVEEAYQRISHDINANHILIRLDENASPEDTLAAYKNIMKLRDRALQEGFDKVRKEVHNGQTVFGEELGYFSGFKMVYAFETVAYNTQVGAISEPFRTRFGYHILKVLDKRASEGEREVAHIMILSKSGDSLSAQAEEKIKSIYKRLEAGEAFEDLAKQFSEDKNSAPKGGLLPEFSRGQISAKAFEDVAFNLKAVGDYSEPFKTNFGWHIVKLYKIKPIPDFESMRPELEGKVKRDSRSKLIDEALVNKLKTKYNVPEFQPALAYFESIVTDDYFKNSWQLPESFTADKTLLVIGNKKLLYNDFGQYLLNTQRFSRKKERFKSLISTKYEAFLKTNLLQYQEEHLEYENEDFAHIVEEYRDGLLLFDLMENTIWNTAKSDSTGVKQFYNSHKDNYVLPERVDAVVVSSTKQRTLNKVKKLLQQNMTVDEVKSLIRGNDQIEAIFTVGIMDKEHQALPKPFEFKKGLSKVNKYNGAFVLVKVNDILPKTQKTLDEARGAVISDYQAYKEEQWVNELAQKYKVVVNQDVLEQVKAQLK